MTEKQARVFEALYYTACVVIVLWPLMVEYEPAVRRAWYLFCYRVAAWFGDRGLHGEREYHEAIERVSYR